MDIVWTEALRKQVIPRRGRGEAPPLPPGSREPALAAWSLIEGQVRRGLEMHTALHAGTKALLDDKALTPEHEGALYRLLYDHADAADALARWWIGSQGLEFAVASLVHASSIETGNRAGVSRWLRPPSEPLFDLGTVWNAWTLVRLEACRSTDDGFVERLWATAGPTARCALAYAFPAPARVTRAISELRQGQAGEAAARLLASTERGDEALELTRLFIGRGRVGELLDLLPTMLSGVGIEAVPALALLVATLAEETWSPEPARRAAEVLACVRTQESFDALAPYLLQEKLRPAIVTAFRDTPRLSVPILARQERPPEVVSQLLAAIVRMHPDVCRELAATIPKLQKLIDGQHETLPEATPSELPPALASPPAMRTRRGKRKLPAGLLPVPYEETIALTDEPKRAERLKQDASAWNEYVEEQARRGRLYWAQEVIGGLGHDELRAKIAQYGAKIFAELRPGALLPLVSSAGLAALPELVELTYVAPSLLVDVVAIDSPRLAAPAARAFAHVRTARAAAEAWLLKHPRAALHGLLPQCASQTADDRTAASRALQMLAHHGHEDLLRHEAARFGAEGTQLVEAVLDSDAVLEVPSVPPKLVWEPSALPRPKLREGKVLPEQAIGHIGLMLAFTPESPPYRGLAEVREACDPHSLHEFVWALGQSWILAGGPPKEAWAFTAMGHLGNDETATALAPLVNAWPSEMHSPWAYRGLDVLALIGTDVALMHLHRLSLKAKSRPLRLKAEEKVAQVAAQRGLTAEELEDRLVPDLELDARGTRVLESGGRRFTVGFDEQLRPFVRDEGGARVKDLPNDEWKLLKKTVRGLASDQLLRLEAAMCRRRRWTLADFRACLVEHPLLQHLTRRLVWGAYVEGALVQTFRVVEDGTYASETDDACELPAGAAIGIVHPLELAEALAGTWGQLLADYEILQPFRQLGRSVRRVEGADPLARFEKAKVPSTKVLGLERLGWTRGAVQDGGYWWDLTKRLGDGASVALTLEPGIFAGNPTEHPEQSIASLRVAGELHPIDWSEVLVGLESLRS